MLGRMQQEHVLGAGSLAAGPLILGAIGVCSDLQTAPFAPACPSLTSLSSNRTGDAHAQFPLRTKLTSHWMSLLLQTNTLKNLFQTSKKKVSFQYLKCLKCASRGHKSVPLFFCSSCVPQHTFACSGTECLGFGTGRTQSWVTSVPFPGAPSAGWHHGCFCSNREGHSNS